MRIMDCTTIPNPTRTSFSKDDNLIPTMLSSRRMITRLAARRPTFSFELAIDGKKKVR